MTRLRPYLSAFRLRARLETQYRAAALGGVVTQLFFGLALACLYAAIFPQGDENALAETISYLWLQQMFFRALMARDAELEEQIMTGAVAYTLLRPLDQHLWWTCRNLAQALIGVMMRALPMLAAQLLIPAPMRLHPPESPLALAQFAVSIAVGLLCVSQIHMITMAISMRTLDNKGISGMINLLMMFLCGNIIPLTLFPAAIQEAVRYQPFAQALDAPIRMYLHTQTASAFALNLGIQALWLVALTCLARRMWRMNLRRMVVQGG